MQRPPARIRGPFMLSDLHLSVAGAGFENSPTATHGEPPSVDELQKSGSERSRVSFDLARDWHAGHRVGKGIVWHTSEPSGLSANSVQVITRRATPDPICGCTPRRRHSRPRSTQK